MTTLQEKSVKEKANFFGEVLKSDTDTIRGATSNETFREGFRLITWLVNVLGVIIFVLLLTNLYFVHNYTSKDRYFAETADGQKIKLQGLPEPNMNKDAILSWSTIVATRVMTFSFSDYEERMAELRPYFTDRGWKDFRKIMDKSGLVKTVTNSQQVLTAVPRNRATILSEGVWGGKKTWVVQVPILMTFRSGNAKKSDPQNVRLVVVKVPTTELAGGIGVDQWISF